MTLKTLSEQAQAYLHRLSVEIQGRSVGSAGNRVATDFFADTIASFGFATERPTFDCLDWASEGVALSVDNTPFEVFAGPFSPGCDVHAPLLVVNAVEELERVELSNKVVLLRGDIARQQLMPKNFTFYNPDEHKHIIHLLETKNPLAIVAATSRDVEMVGSLYPFPLIEDGDFDIPSVYMTDEEGLRLVQHAGSTVSLQLRAQRRAAQGCNVIARKGADLNHRVVVFAHVDAKMGTPGAIDNGGGVVVLLLLAELLADYAGKLGVEIVALNGEDYFSNPGEQQYLMRNEGQFGEIVLGINIDGVGYHEGRTAYSLYDCAEDSARLIRQVLEAHGGMMEGPQWYQGDHVLYLINQRPALALTSEHAAELLTEVIHTSKDTPDIVDPERLVGVAEALRDVILLLDQPSG